jgi:hypothetical protein
MRTGVVNASDIANHPTHRMDAVCWWVFRLACGVPPRAPMRCRRGRVDNQLRHAARTGHRWHTLSAARHGVPVDECAIEQVGAGPAGSAGQRWDGAGEVGEQRGEIHGDLGGPHRRGQPRLPKPTSVG